jgi:scyllo-inositol 2-dehydrogenase (NAD+)
MTGQLNLGVIGLGRLGTVYAKDLAQRVANARLVAVADVQAERASQFAAQYGIPKAYRHHHDLIADKDIDAVAVVTPTSTHKEVVIDAARAGKAVFCEKPLSLSLDDAAEMREVVETAGIFFQPGFQRRFDAGYLAAKEKIEQGVIGTPVVFTSTSRDPFRPPLEFCDPKASGGLIVDMGIHDFDVARMYMGDVKTVHAVGGALAYPEMKTIGDIDNAIIDLVFENEGIGAVHLSRNAVFGYDIRAEIWGTKGSLQIGYHRHTPILVMTEGQISHDVVPHFMQRFESAYLAQIQSFVDGVRGGGKPAVTCLDAVAALRVSLAAAASQAQARPVHLTEIGSAAGPSGIAC